jgi:hypothetical protein
MPERSPSREPSAPTSANGSRPLRVLLAGRPGTLTRFTSVVRELAERGHAVTLVIRSPHPLVVGLAESLHARYPNVTHEPAPLRGDLDGWRYVAWLVRGLGDLARYTHPRYEGAPVLRQRMAEETRDLIRKKRFEPLGRAVASRVERRLETTIDAELSERAVRTAGRMEDAIPSSKRIERYLREREPDVVLVSSIVRLASEEVELLKSARRLGIPGGICVASWDNLTNKGLLKFVPDRVFVWNEAQVSEAAELHGIPADRVRATGAGLFDEWFERRASRTAEEFAHEVGLDPARPFVAYLCSSRPIARHGEVEFVTAWIQALRASGDERLRSIGVLVRPHPTAGRKWGRADLTGLGNAVVWPREGAFTVAAPERDDFFDTLAHAAAVVGINTTAMIEAAVVGKSVLTVLRPEFAQETTLHFHHLLAENGGFLHVAATLDEHVAQLGAVLAGDDVEARRRFVERFVRPQGIDRPATPILAVAIEELAELEVEPGRPGQLPLRIALGAEAMLSSAYAAPRHAVRHLRRGRRSRGAEPEGAALEAPSAVRTADR